MTIVTIVNIASIAILFLLKDKLWNNQFISTLVDYQFIVEGSDGYQTVIYLWEQFTFWIIILAILGLIVNILISFKRSS